MPNIVHPLALKNPSTLFVTDIEGKTTEHPTVTCKHCGRVYSLRCDNPEVSFATVLASIKRCTKCDGYVCPSPACRVDCNPFKADVERAYREDHRQPWMLREFKANEPVLRIYGPYGKPKLIPRRQSGFTERELARMARPSLGEPAAKASRHVDAIFAKKREDHDG